MRRFISRISIRLLAFNILLVFLPVAGVSYLEVYERKLLQAQEQSMVQQGRLLAAALAERLPLQPEMVEPILVRLDQETTSRIRVIDRDRRLVSDTSRLGPQREREDATAGASQGPRTSRLYQLGSGLFRAFDRLVSGPRATVGRDYYSADAPFDGAEIDQAFSGDYGAATRITPGGQRSVTLYSALPIQADGERVGVVLVSQSTFQILQDLYEVRLAIFEFLLIAIGVAAVLSLLVSTTISRPIRRLQGQARLLLDRRGRITGRFQGSERLDEIGDLSRTLQELSSRLEERMHFIESFAADVSHEFKNPLASMRAAAEMLADVEDPADRQRFAHLLQIDIARLEKLLSEVREVTLLDASRDEGPASVALNTLVQGIVAQERYRDRRIELQLGRDESEEEVFVSVGPDHMTRVIENLLDNALDFSEGAVRLETAIEGDLVRLVVDDDGPGIPPESAGRVFDRFFSYRPETGSNQHSGLGLAIVKAIVERRGGSIRLADSSLGGAAIEVRLRRASRESEPAEIRSHATARTHPTP